jgi:hypothetical protein
MKALYDFCSTQPNELPLSQGDVVQVLEKDNSGWTMVKLNQQQG